MKLIFLHGLGQIPEDWETVMNEVKLSDTIAVPLFSDISQTDLIDLATLNKKLSAVLDDLNEPYLLCGLSLGGVLALQQATRKQPFLKGVIASGVQYKSPNKYLLTIQNLIFRLMPKKSFQNMNVTKKQLIGLVNSMRHLNLKEDLSNVTIPFLLMCGSKDRANLSAAKELSLIMNQSTLKIISNGGHELNREQPKEFANAINNFLKEAI